MSGPEQRAGGRVERDDGGRTSPHGRDAGVVPLGDEAAGPSPGAPLAAGPACPVPLDRYPTVTLAHGGGGRLSHTLVTDVLLAAYGNEELERLGDGAFLEVDGGRLAFSTDSFVVTPWAFPGGDIGSLAVHGTVNDLAMCGAVPRALSVGLILEEGFRMEDLWRVARSVGAAAREAGVRVVTGDTKVVDRGKGDGVFINTSGIGVVPEGVGVGAHRIRPGDAILVSGPIANHGVAILSLREGLEFETVLESDSAPLHGLVADLRDGLGRDLHALRDPTRGGVASALVELARAAGVGMTLEQARIPLDEPVRGACEILGLDPLYVANEGKLLAFVDGSRAEEARDLLRARPLGRGAEIIGRVVEDARGQVVQRSAIGGTRVVEMLSGEQLPRIC